MRSFHMPQTIGMFIGQALFAIGAPVAVVNFFAIGAGATLIGVGLSVGLNFLATSLLRPRANAPQPEDVQQSLRQPTAARVRHVGRVKTSGPWVFAESKSGQFHKVVALGVGPIDAIEELWIDDTQVTVDGSGFVQTSPWTDKCRILTRLGDTPETYFSQLSANFPEWTSSHRGDGVAQLYARQYDVDSSKYLSTFPNGIHTNYRAVIRGPSYGLSVVEPRHGTTTRPA